MRAIIKYFCCSNSFTVSLNYEQENKQVLICQKVIQNYAAKDQERENAYWIGDIEKASEVGST